MFLTDHVKRCNNIKVRLIFSLCPLWPGSAALYAGDPVPYTTERVTAANVAVFQKGIIKTNTLIIVLFSLNV